jgi:hypothetical protein
VRGFVRSGNLKGYAGCSLATGRVSLARQAEKRVYAKRNTLVFKVESFAGRPITPPPHLII